MVAKAGEIEGLQLLEKFPMVINNFKVGEVWADFTYQDKKRGLVREDVKGKDTRESRLKRKLVKAVHGVDLEIVR